ncbi:MAG: hypothetical protein M3319_08205, partial [Actinomycetota bacterium]|nr:hypothetical protein [Actinomycetota bacterium]
MFSTPTPASCAPDPNPLSYDQAGKLRGARPAAHHRARRWGGHRDRRPSATGVIMVAGRKLSLGRPYA